MRRLDTLDQLVVNVARVDDHIGLRAATDGVHHPVTALGQLVQLDLLALVVAIVGGSTLGDLGLADLTLADGDLLLCLAEVILDLFTCRKRANHLRLKLANCDGRVGGPLHEIGPGLTDFEHTVTMRLSCVAQAREPCDLIAVTLDRLELLGETSLHLLLVLLLVGQHFGVVDEAVDLFRVVLQIAQGGFELGNAGGGFRNAGRRRRATALLLACGSPIAVSLGGYACPEIVLTFACGVTPGGQIERVTRMIRRQRRPARAGCPA